MEHTHLEALYPTDCRFAEIEKIIHFVQDGTSCQVVGMPGVGRGNLFEFLAYNFAIRSAHVGDAQAAYHFVFINFVEIKNRSLFDSTKFIFLQLISSLQERGLTEMYTYTDAIFKDALVYQDELVLFQGLKKVIEYIALEKGLTLILLFERFETYLPMLTEAFFVQLRSLRDLVKYKFSVVFSVTRPLEETVEPLILADFYEFFAGHTVYLALADKPSISFTIAYQEKLAGTKLPQACSTAILGLTGGQEKLTRLAIEFVLESHALCPDSILLLEQPSIQQGLRELWQFLSPSEQQTVREIAVSKTSEQDLSFLTDIGLVAKTDLTIPLFSTFVTTVTKDEMPQETIHYDEKTNTIRKGATVLSEQLTSLECKLLHFLLTNPDTVISRETLIQAVWKESASTLGVTDQALDQLLFRLRKKIEENPKEPRHVRTVKGRGIQWSN